MDWSCHSDEVQSAPTSHFILWTAAWPASPWRPEEALLRSCEGNLEEMFNTSWLARDTGIWQSSLERCVWGGSDGFRHQLRQGGKSTSRSSTHDHKYSSIRSSLSYLWQYLRVRIRAPESSSFSPSVCFLASAASLSFIDGQQQASIVKWNGCFSDSCVITSGIRQGGILSPALFNIYADVLLQATLAEDTWDVLPMQMTLFCFLHLFKVLKGCLTYVIIKGLNLILFSMQRSRVCVKLAKWLANRLMSFSSDIRQLIGLIGWSILVYVSAVKNNLVLIYLLLYVKYMLLLMQFWAIVGLFQTLSDLVLWSLYVLPILTYALKAISLTNSMIREFSVCWNNVYRRIFGMNKWFLW